MFINLMSRSINTIFKYYFFIIQKSVATNHGVGGSNPSSPHTRGTSSIYTAKNCKSWRNYHGQATCRETCTCGSDWYEDSAQLSNGRRCFCAAETRKGVTSDEFFFLWTALRALVFCRLVTQISPSTFQWVKW